MDYNQRGGQPMTAPTAAAPHPAPRGGNKKFRGRGMRVISTVMLVLIALLIAALAIFIATGGTKKESTFIDDDKYQAVFLNGGQVYFGKIDNMNEEFLTMSKIYYLRVNEQTAQGADQNQQQAQQDISLAKLGCELHGPEDEMVINRSQVTFWENLKDDGQVVKAITEFVKQNPDGQKCAEPTS